MLEIKVYGTGCAKCNRLAANAEVAARELGVAYRIEKITDADAIIDAGVMITPALVIDGQIKVAGKAPSPNELQDVLARC
jgi:small redox-active disulfide protein 2